MLGELLYRVGYAAGRLEAYANRRQAHADSAPPPHRRRTVPARETGVGDGSELRRQMEEALKDAAERWFMGRMLRARSVNWPAVLFAGLASTAVSDLVAYLTDPTRPHPLDEDPEDLIARYSAGIASTSAYASIFYPRMPGSPMTRGAVYGLLDVVTEPEGGIIEFGRRFVPHLRFPLKPFALPVNEDAGPMARLAFGLALGLFYRVSPG